MPSLKSNKRIAINTAYMYLRLFITLVIGLYTSRIVLLVLGFSDYGLFNVVGGILTMFTFISGSLSAATSRFFNVEMGKSDGDLNRSYNINIALHVILAVITLLLAETVGLWYIYSELNVPSGRIGDAVFVFQISIFSACLGIISGPCVSLFSAFEKFGFITKLDIANTLIRLGCVMMMQYCDGNALRFYTLIMCFTTVNAFVVYYWVAHREWPEILKLKFVKGWNNYKNVLSFGGWNLLSTIALMVRSTGCDLVINHFFNTTINGAFAISKTVNNYVTTFSTNFDSASGPQIIQSYSGCDYERCSYLVNKLGRFCLLLFEVVFFPLYIELEFLLTVWLKNVPTDVVVFCRYNLILAAVALTCGGLVQLINASGKIKWFKINGAFFFVICVPIGYWLYSIGAPAYSMLVLFIIADVIQRIIQLILLKIVVGFNSWIYVKEAFGRPFYIAMIMSLLLWIHSFVPIEGTLLKITAIVVCTLTVGILVYTIGLTAGEKVKIKQLALSKLHRFL